MATTVSYLLRSDPGTDRPLSEDIDLIGQVSDVIGHGYDFKGDPVLSFAAGMAYTVSRVHIHWTLGGQRVDIDHVRAGDQLRPKGTMEAFVIPECFLLGLLWAREPGGAWNRFVRYAIMEADVSKSSAFRREILHHNGMLAVFDPERYLVPEPALHNPRLGEDMYVPTAAELADHYRKRITGDLHP